MPSVGIAGRNTVSGLVIFKTPIKESPVTVLESLSPRALAAPESGIVEVITYARGREGLIPLWAGEGDLLLCRLLRHL